MKAPKDLRPSVVIELDDGTGTWVTRIPVATNNYWELLRAIGECVTLFLHNLSVDRKYVERNLREFNPELLEVCQIYKYFRGKK